jgi:ankyrin repeat protein
MKPKSKPPGNKYSTLKCDILLSNSAFKFNWRRYTMAALIAAGGNVSIANASGKLPIHLAVEAGDKAAIDALASSPAFSGTASAADGGGHTPLHLAVMHDQPEIVKTLLAANAGPARYLPHRQEQEHHDVCALLSLLLDAKSTTNCNCLPRSM